ncbi:carbohydrate kinase [Aliiglaciecola sp. CAU 1673]|uniref:carbohydrate kinase family protein n=1 Tax=Aliiglaciecola sp. CAU 1673 TaxID=3032595 RepID=UPI0023DA9F7C|nr:carbohydrate kinase [Aliiglaciecola sp. CAU 1673]MDF2178611.1 carbohydrate kinase [Aliiglaciecola sp. CAU 1673]
MKKILCFGEALIDFLNTGKASQGPLALNDFRQYPGGAPANAAVAVAGLGGRAFFAGQVGQDPFGDFLQQALQAYGVDTRYLCRHPSAKTALAFVMLDGAGERSFSFYRQDSADLLFDATSMGDDCFEAGGILHICSNTLTTEAIAKTTQDLVARAKTAGNLVSFDVNLRHNLWASGQADRQRVNALVQQADMVKFSKEELDYLSQGKTRQYLDHCLAKGCQLLLVTDGPGAIQYHCRAGSGEVSPPKVQAVDTTAGGDAFIGGVLYALGCLEDSVAALNDPKQLESILTLASHCGAHAVMRPGAFPALPDLPGLAAQLNEHGLATEQFHPAFFRSLV